ncbi:DNA-directed RNA polymerase II subunit RPB1 [Hordeum vulgare]|nr:DNA-directed RNA polymerase II subunit RPB1 [Hordeum vulgare]
MQEAMDIEQCREDELRMAEDEVEQSISIKESAMEYQCEIWRSHYYEYSNLDGGAKDEEEDDDAVDFCRGDAWSTNGGMSPRQVIDVSSYTSEK